MLPTPTPRLVFLNGTPSSGKSTLARALHSRSPEPTFYLSLDTFRYGIQETYWTGPRVPDLFRSMLEAWLDSLRLLALRGFPVIAESVIVPPDVDRYAALFGEFDVVLIGVRCPLAVATEREAHRTDRRNGPMNLDTPEFESVHQHRYELEIDTSTEPTDTSVRRILDHLHRRQPAQPWPDL